MLVVDADVKLTTERLLTLDEFPSPSSGPAANKFCPAAALHPLLSHAWELSGAVSLSSIERKDVITVSLLFTHFRSGTTFDPVNRRLIEQG